MTIPNNTLYATVLYDGDCSFCLASARLLRTLARGKLQALPLQEHFQDFPHIDYETAMQEMQLITKDGRNYSGAEAVAKIIEMSYPIIGYGAKLYYIPGIRYLCDRGYRWFARNRYRWFRRQQGCESGVCGVKYK